MDLVFSILPPLAAPSDEEPTGAGGRQIFITQNQHLRHRVTIYRRPQDYRRRNRSLRADGEF